MAKQEQVLIIDPPVELSFVGESHFNQSINLFSGYTYRVTKVLEDIDFVDLKMRFAP